MYCAKMPALTWQTISALWCVATQHVESSNNAGSFRIVLMRFAACLPRPQGGRQVFCHTIDAVRRAHRILVCSVSKGKPRIGYKGI